jgi:hypothetical protein
MTLFFGTGTGFLAGIVDKPIERRDTVRVGAIAGVLAGLGLMAGEIVGEFVFLLLMGPEFANATKRIGHLPGDFAYEANYWVVFLLRSISGGLSHIVLMVGFSVIGILIWGKLIRDKHGIKSNSSHELVDPQSGE